MVFVGGGQMLIDALFSCRAEAKHPRTELWDQAYPSSLQLFLQAMRRRLRVSRVMFFCFCLSVWGQEY